MNRKSFFGSLRDSFGHLKQSQVDGINNILECDLTDDRHKAYALATAYHETAHTMQPIKEFGLGHGHKYGEIDPVTKEIYYGRGLVQLTWAHNYKKMGELLGLPLYENPNLALVPAVATQIMSKGMMLGSFTGKKLSDYFNEHTSDAVNARRIINGLDRADKIAGYYDHFYTALKG